MKTLLASLALAGAMLAAMPFALGASSPRTTSDHASRPFTGVKANTGRVIHSMEDGRTMLALSDDFKIPDAPAPHWQLVDSQGETYLLQRLDIKDGKFNRSIVVPDHVPDIAKVRIWCAWAETVLGETMFDTVIDLQAQMTHTSSGFAGVKANTGSVTHTHEGRRCVLTLSDDFKVPDAPAPHWQVVDSAGRTYLLQRLDIKDGRFNRSITVPDYVPDIVKVQIWCAWAEVLLGEASFDAAVR
jgi:hypothetical protein